MNVFGIKKEDIKTEIFAGLTTFLTMSYIIIIIPKLLEQAGMPFEPVFTSLLIVAGVSSIFSGLFSNMPFAVAPYLSDSVFIAYTLTPSYNWREIMAVVMLTGVFLIIMTFSKFRIKFVDSMPYAIKMSFVVGLGFYLLLSGLKNGGILDFSGNILTLRFNNFSDFHIWLPILGVALIFILNRFKVKISVILTIVLLTVLGLFLKDTTLPNQIFSLPSSPSLIFAQADFSNIFSKNMIALFFMLFLLINTEFHGTTLSVLMKYNVDDFSTLQNNVNKFFFADSSATIASSAFGVPASGVYADSVTGIAAGGKSGLTAVTVGVLFLISLFFAPLFKIFPSYAYSSALIFVGLLLFSEVKEIKYNDITESLSCWIIIAAIVFTLNIALGMAFAFILYPLVKLLFGRIKEVPKEFWFFSVLAVIFFFIR